MTAELFLGFVALMVAVVVALAARYVGGGAAFRLLAALCAWLAYAGLLGYFGIIRNTAMRPPGIVFLAGPIVLFLVLFIVFVARSSGGARLATAFPPWILVGTQTFRVGVELFLHRLWNVGLVPKMLTF